MNKIAGFCIVKSDADCSKCSGGDKEWRGQMATVLEINEETKRVLLIRGANMGMLDFDQIKRKFTCDDMDGVLLPPGLDTFEKMEYATLVKTRNGGYSPLLRKMVIASSLHREEFCDSVLWQKGQSDSTVRRVNQLKERAKAAVEKKQKQKEKFAKAGAERGSKKK